YLHLVTEAMKHAFADRAQFLGDPDFVHVPVSKLTAKDYAAWVRGRISPEKTQPTSFYGYYHYRSEEHTSELQSLTNLVCPLLLLSSRLLLSTLFPYTTLFRSYLHLVTEAMKHAFADRAQFLGDPDFVHVPVSKLTAKDYAAWVRGRISPEKTQPTSFYGYYHY